MTIDPKTCDPTAVDVAGLYGQAYETFRDESKRGLSWRASVRAVVDLALTARPERPAWEVLRAALDILDRHDWPRELEAPDVFDFVHEVADGLEAEHKRAQAEKAAHAEREKLIERAAEIIDGCPEAPARALADADLLAVSDGEVQA